MEVDRNGLEVLARDECLRLLTTATIGRIGLTCGALPTVLPVNFRLVDDQIIFRTTKGSKLEAATRNAVVAFEADDYETFEHGGWSVVVTGVAREVTDRAELEALPPVARWAGRGEEHLVAISTEMVDGRRLVH